MPIDFGTPIGPDTGFNVFTSGGNGFNLQSVTNLLTDLERYSVNGQLSYDISTGTHAFFEGWWSKSSGRNLAAQPAYNASLFDVAGARDGNLIIPLSNPFLSPAARAAIANSIATNPLSDQNLGAGPQDYFYLARANVDLQPGISLGKLDVLRFVAGLESRFDFIGPDVWRFEASVNFGRSITNGEIQSLNQQNFLNALNSMRDASGTIVCAPGYTNSPIATLSSTCAPLNPFGSHISQEAREYITSIARPRSINKQYDAIISVAGPLIALPGGNLSMALGYEHRDESSRFDPGAFLFGVPGPGRAAPMGAPRRSTLFTGATTPTKCSAS